MKQCSVCGNEMVQEDDGAWVCEFHGDVDPTEDTSAEEKQDEYE